MSKQNSGAALAGWTLEDKVYGVLSAAAPLIAFACAATFYGNFAAATGEPMSLSGPDALWSALGLTYFLAMVAAAIVNLSGLVAKFETGEPISRAAHLMFAGLVAFGAANILIALVA